MTTLKEWGLIFERHRQTETKTAVAHGRWLFENQRIKLQARCNNCYLLQPLILRIPTSRFTSAVVTLTKTQMPNLITFLQQHLFFYSFGPCLLK